MEIDQKYLLQDHPGEYVLQLLWVLIRCKDTTHPFLLKPERQFYPSHDMSFFKYQSGQLC
jgi:hypothetical protein